MIKEDLVRQLVGKEGLDREKATLAVETILHTIIRTLERHERVELRGFGVFSVRPRKSGVGRNPKSPQETIPIPPGYAVRFRPGKDLKGIDVEKGPA